VPVPCTGRPDHHFTCETEQQASGLRCLPSSSLFQAALTRTGDKALPLRQQQSRKAHDRSGPEGWSRSKNTASNTTNRESWPFLPRAERGHPKRDIAPRASCGTYLVYDARMEKGLLELMDTQACLRANSGVGIGRDKQNVTPYLPRPGRAGFNRILARAGGESFKSGSASNLPHCRDEVTEIPNPLLKTRAEIPPQCPREACAFVGAKRIRRVLLSTSPRRKVRPMVMPRKREANRGLTTGPGKPRRRARPTSQESNKLKNGCISRGFAKRKGRAIPVPPSGGWIRPFPGPLHLPSECIRKREKKPLYMTKLKLGKGGGNR